MSALTPGWVSIWVKLLLDQLLNVRSTLFPPYSMMPYTEVLMLEWVILIADPEPPRWMSQWVVSAPPSGSMPIEEYETSTVPSWITRKSSEECDIRVLITGSLTTGLTVIPPPVWTA